MPHPTDMSRMPPRSAAVYLYDMMNDPQAAYDRLAACAYLSPAASVYMTAYAQHASRELLDLAIASMRHELAAEVAVRTVRLMVDNSTEHTIIEDGRRIVATCDHFLANAGA